MRLLITGSSGQIGTNLALRCLADGLRVQGLDQRANTWSSAVETVIANLATPSARPGLLGGCEVERPDLVVHLAAHAKVHELVLKPALALENIAATHAVLEYCRHWHLPIILASSREVYGNIHLLRTAEASADFVTCESPYSASKIAGEALAYAYARCYALPHIVFRFSNVYGRYDDDLERMERVIPLFIARIERGLPVTVFGADKVLDFTHVDDCVEGIMRGIRRLSRGEVTGETINLACGRGHSLMQLAEYIGLALGTTPRIVTEPARTGEVTHYVADLERARRLLGYAPKLQLPEGIARTVAERRRRPGA